LTIGDYAELYDPTTGVFTPAGKIFVVVGQSATLLADGRVLIAGGYGPDRTFSARAELYDPVTGTFAPTGQLTTPRAGHEAILLANGKVLLVGGDSSSVDITAELYDPATGTFAATGSFVGVTEFGSATLLPDGRVLVVAYCCARAVNSLAGLYDPGSGTFSPTGRPIGLHSSTIPLTNGKVLFAGGIGDGIGEDSSAELYDPATGTFTATGNMTTPRLDHSAALLGDGTVLLAGSQRNPDNCVPCGIPSAELYDPAAGTFLATGDMITPRFSAATVLLPDGTVLIAGGGSTRAVTATAEIYHPNVLIPAPVLFSLSGDGRGQGAILHADTHQLVSPDNPAVAGEAVEIYLTGLIDGAVIPPQVAIGGRMAEVLFFGNAPGWPALNQINVRVPSGVTAGRSVSVRLNYLNRPSNEVTMVVK